MLICLLLFDQSEEDKAKKRLEYEKLSAKHFEERSRREGELLAKFDVVVDRVVASREEQPVDNEDMWAGAVNSAVSRVDLPSFVCSTCGNKVSAVYAETR